MILAAFRGRKFFNVRTVALPSGIAGILHSFPEVQTVIYPEAGPQDRELLCVIQDSCNKVQELRIPEISTWRVGGMVLRNHNLFRLTLLAF